MSDVSMNTEDWRSYATALDDAARSLEAFTRWLDGAAGANELFATAEGVLGYRDLFTAHGKLVGGLREQARQARLKADPDG